MSNVPNSYRIVDQITTATDKRFELVARMADAIVEKIFEGYGCNQQDLFAKGFAEQDVAVFWHFANALAAVELRCREKNLNPNFGKNVRCA